MQQLYRKKLINNKNEAICINMSLIKIFVLMLLISNIRNIRKDSFNLVLLTFSSLETSGCCVLVGAVARL